MASKTLFKTTNTLPANTVNKAGGIAYSLSDKEALAQLVTTGCLNQTYYATADEQLDQIKSRCAKVDPEFLAKLAVYGRQNARMKDTPAYILAWLFGNGHTELVQSIFTKVVDDMKMLCNFVQIVRSGAAGRKSFGTLGKQLINDFITKKGDMELFRMNIGHSDPSFTDIIKMTHPKASNDSQNNMFKYILNKDFNLELLPPDVMQFEKFKKDSTLDIPSVDFRLLSNITMTEAQWCSVAESMGWTTLRMNLNTIGRHGVFNNKQTLSRVAAKLSDREAVLKSKVMPYQIMTAYLNAECPDKISNALQDAMEIATETVPSLGDVAVCVDVSGSMSSPITGHRGTVTTKMNCLNIAALIASCLIRKNDDVKTVLFDGNAREMKLNSRDSVMTNSKIISAQLGGSTNCGAAIALMNQKNYTNKTVIMISDNESWCGMDGRWGQTGMRDHWNKYKARVKGAKLVLIDIQPGTTTQAQSDSSVLNIGSFNDSVWPVIQKFVNGETSSFVAEIEKTSLT